YMPITYWTAVIGSLALAGIPPFAGFFSKDAIIELTHLSTTPGATFAYLCVLACVFVTACYTFRLVFMAFHGEPRFDPAHPPHESPKVVTVPLVLLAIPSVGAGWWVGSFVFGDYFGSSIVGPKAPQWHGLWSYTLHGLAQPPFWLAIAGIGTAWYLYCVRLDLPKRIAVALGPLYALVERKYGFDELYQWLFAGGARRIGEGFWKGGDQRTIDGLLVNGSARMVGWFSGVVSLLQSGLIYKYAVWMLFGILLAMTWFLFLAPKA
ncbi:MAG TPA: proton-conducting transporter membrane subunit, partial [Burkholderiales bacterium]|nr:proton-conducting transporter membrane subunit [Burkholderiales bacterium]